MCPARIYFKDLAKQGKIQEDVRLPLIFGSAVHKGIEERLVKGTNPYKVAQDYVASEIEKSPFRNYTGDEYKDRSDLLVHCLDNFERDFYPDLHNTLTDPASQVEVSLEMPYRKGTLVGKIDLVLPGILSDWKTGMVPKPNENVADNPQTYFYAKLAEYSSLGLPKLFVYVHLAGKNIAYRPPKRGNGRPVLNKEEPEYKYSWPVYPTPERVESVFRNTIDPLAKAYEQRIYYKNKSAWNCSSCRFRTACDQYDLPRIED